MESGLNVAKVAAVDVGVETGHNVALQFIEELVIGLADSYVIAVVFDGFDGHGFLVLLKGHFRIVLLGYGCLRVRNNVAFSDRAALQRYGCILGFEDSPSGFLDRAHNAEDFTQGFPVVRETGYEVDFTSRYNDVLGFGQSIKC